MGVRFRPLRNLTIAFLFAFAAMMALGTWQIERLHWKEGLIAQAGTNMKAAPIGLAEAERLGLHEAQYRHVVLRGRFDHAHEAFVFTTGEGGKPVYHVITPFLLVGGGVLMVDRGMVPLTLKDPAARAAGQVEGEQNIVGVWRVPDPPGMFTPAPDRPNRVWYDRDVEGMARAAGINLTAPVIIEADAAANPGGWPRGGQTVVTFRNDHLQYAITWYALGVVLLGVYLAYHRAQGRLGLR
ncbi:MAG: SURF1 family protein [Alphaproteobacteria bacterium]|nr:SURF1 family protein [Alphaproteobacteria bacterium]